MGAGLVIEHLLEAAPDGAAALSAVAPFPAPLHHDQDQDHD